MTFESVATHPSQRWWILAAASLGAFVAAMMATAVNVALPSLARTFDVPFAAVQWVVLGYLVMTASLLPIVGRLADMFGKRTIFLVGFAIYALGSLATGFAPNLGSLIAFRLIHGAGSSILTGLGLAIVTDVFPPEERGRAIGVTGSLLSIGIVLGPTLGGLLVQYSWRLVFLFGLPLALVGLALAYRFVPHYPRGARQRFDLLGAALLVVVLATGSLALTIVPEVGVTNPLFLALAACVLVGLPLLIAWEHRSPDPIIDPAMLRYAPLAVGLMIGLAVFVSISGTIFVMPFYLEDVLGLQPRSVGLLMSVTPLLLVFVSPVAGSMADRFGDRLVTLVGLVLALVGFSLVATLDVDTTAMGYVLRFVFVGLGMATFQSANNTAIMNASPPGRSGVTGSLLGLTRAFGQSAGIAVLGTFWAARIGVRTSGLGAEAGTDLAALAEVGAVHDMMRLVQGLLVVAIVLAIWDLRRRRRSQEPRAA